MGAVDGRRALVTGGASGIGKAAARLLAAEGADVCIGDVDDAGGKAAADEIGAAFATLDVADPDAWDGVVAAEGPFDIGFLNAGVPTREGRQPGQFPVIGMSDEAYRKIMAVNVDGVVFGARALLPHLLERRHGDIVMTASLAGIGPIGWDPVYGLTKHGVVGLVRSLAAAVDSHPLAPDICVSSICPGFVDTNIMTPETKQRVTAMGAEFMSPDYVAGVVLRALTERVNGAQWVIWPDVEPAPYEWAPTIDLGLRP
jgi:NAD(P)-dependent dehydrogenase (short-subunit alcohol dehydrogenase family)